MKNILILVLILSQCIANAQRIPTEVVKKALMSYQKRATDTIQIKRNGSEKVRNEMKALVKALKYEPFMVFGPKDTWINEDMNLNFESAPKPFFIVIKRDERQVKLEAYHIQLYWLDISLYTWKRIQKTTDSLMLKDTLPENLIGYDYDENEPLKLTKKEAQKLANSRVATMLYSENTAYFQNRNQLLEQEKSKVPKYVSPKTLNDTALISATVATSYPAQGQYNFYLGEATNRKGYVNVQSDSFRVIVNRNNFYEYNFFAVWEDNHKYHSLQAANIEMSTIGDSGFNLLIPEDLKLGTFYHLRIIGTREDENGQPISSLVWENYFRTSKYFMVDKLKKIEAQRPKYDKVKGGFEIKMDEPFDILELSQKNDKPRKLFGFSSGASSGQDPTEYLKSKEIANYLSYPKITPVDTTNLANIPLAEKDNTASLLLKFDAQLYKSSSYDSRFSGYDRDTIRMGNLTFLAKNLIEKDTITGNYVAPMVSKIDFEKGNIKTPNSNVYNVGLTGLKIQYDVNKAIYKEIERRIDEKSNYIYQLAIRAWKKNPSTPRPVLEYYKQNEINHLVSEVQSLRSFIIQSPYTARVSLWKTDARDRNLVVWDIEVLR